MAKAGFRVWGIGGHLEASSEECQAGALPALYIAGSLAITLVCGSLIYKKLVNLYINKSSRRIERQGAIPTVTKDIIHTPMSTLRKNIEEAPQPVTFLCGNVLSLGGTLVLFGPKGEGKSTLAMAMAYAIAKGEACDIIPSDGVQPLPGQAVYYYDLEMHQEQMKSRYEGGVNNLPDLLHWKHDMYNSIDEWLDDVGRQVAGIQPNTNATIVLDNISKCGTGQTSPDVITKMTIRIDGIRDAAKNRGIILSFIIVGHTTLQYASCKPISSSDLAGSSNLVNFADAVMCIGPTRFFGHKLLKVINNRNAPEPDDVIILKRDDEKDGLGFTKVGRMKETDALPRKDGQERYFGIGTPLQGTSSKSARPKSGPNSKIPDEVVDEMVALKEQGLKDGEIAKKIGCTRETVNRRVNERK